MLCPVAVIVVVVAVVVLLLLLLFLLSPYLEGVSEVWFQVIDLEGSVVRSGRRDVWTILHSDLK